MPFFTNWELQALEQAGEAVHSAWAAGDWGRLADGVLEHAARTGETRALAGLIEQEARSDGRSLLATRVPAVLQLPAGPWKRLALALAAVENGHDEGALLEVLEEHVDPNPQTTTMVAVSLAIRFSDRAQWEAAERFERIAARALPGAQATAEGDRFAALWFAAMAVRTFVGWQTAASVTAFDELAAAVEPARRQNRLRRHHATALIALARVHAGRGEWNRAATDLTHASRLIPVQAAEQLGPTKAELAFARFRQGDWHGALVEAQAAEEVLERSPSPTAQGIRSALQALRPALTGDHEAAEEGVRRTRRVLVDRRSVVAETILLHARLAIHVSTKDGRGLLQVLEAEDAPGYRRPYLAQEWFALRGLGLHHLGDRARHRAHVMRWSGLPGAAQSPYFLAHQALVLQADGDGTRALESARRALRQLRRDEDPLGAAWVRSVHGAVECRFGDVQVGVESLDQSRLKLQQLGAAVLAGQIAAQLQNAASPDGTPVPAPLRVLTAQQRKVAQLVADGYTSAEIAGQLFLSKRTVDFHVANIMDRLGLSSRREIKRLVDAAARA